MQPSASDVILPQAVERGAPDSVDITLVLSGAAAETVAYSLGFDGGALVEANGTVTDGEVRLKNVLVPHAASWSPEKPNLHTLTVSVGGGTVSERFGLRRFGVTNGAKLTVNGKVTKLVGWNHHTQWPVTAASPTDEQIAADIALLKKGNANFVRGAHYPHDPRWIDALDEAGILFWSETLGPSVSLKNTKDPKFMKYQLQQLNEMLDNALNHASIFTWGVGTVGFKPATRTARNPLIVRLRPAAHDSGSIRGHRTSRTRAQPTARVRRSRARATRRASRRGPTTISSRAPATSTRR